MDADLLTDTRAELDILMGTSISGLVELGLTKIWVFAFSARVYNVLVRRDFANDSHMNRSSIPHFDTGVCHSIISMSMLLVTV